MAAKLAELDQAVKKSAELRAAQQVDHKKWFNRVELQLGSTAKAYYSPFDKDRDNDCDNDLNPEPFSLQEATFITSAAPRPPAYGDDDGGRLFYLSA